MKQDIIIVSTNDWHGFWFQRQEFATRFAAMGHRIYFINRIPQRIPRPGRVIRWLLSNRQGKGIHNPIPRGVRVISPFLLPPFRSMRGINRLLWRRVWKRLPREERPVSPLLITYQPSFNVIDLIPIVGAARIAYINTHNYNADPSCPRALLDAEKKLVAKADILMADSAANVKRLESYCPDVSVTRAMPGVSVEHFEPAFRGDEAQKANHLMFFGDIGRHLDTAVYNRLAETFKVTLVGITDPVTAGDLSPAIRVKPPVAPAELPTVLKEADILTIFYKSSIYVNSILPAKFFECLATGKPVFVSGLPETRAYSEGVYDIEGSPEKALAFIAQLSELETEARLEVRRKAAREADWGNRFRQFSEKVLI